MNIIELLERFAALGQPLRELQEQLNARPEGRTLPPLPTILPRRQAPAIIINITIIQENPHDHENR